MEIDDKVYEMIVAIRDDQFTINKQLERWDQVFFGNGGPGIVQRFLTLETAEANEHIVNAFLKKGIVAILALATTISGFVKIYGG